MRLNRKDIEIKIIPILKKYDVRKAALFGSYARGDETDKSDIDILVEMGDDKSLLDLSGLQIAITETLHKKADVITYRSIYPRLRGLILKDERIFYEKRSANIS